MVAEDRPAGHLANDRKHAGRVRTPTNQITHKKHLIPIARLNTVEQCRQLSGASVDIPDDHAPRHNRTLTN